MVASDCGSLVIYTSCPRGLGRGALAIAAEAWKMDDVGTRRHHSMRLGTGGFQGVPASGHLNEAQDSV